MRRVISIFLSAILLFMLVSCTTTSEKQPTAPVDLLRVVNNVYFREGIDKDGELILSSENIEGFYTQKSDNSHNQIVFMLNEKGQELFTDATTRLEGEVLSVWIGDEMIASPKIQVPITSKSVALELKLDDDKFESLIKVLEGEM